MKFEQDIHRAIWGEEEWLVSAHPSAPSRIIGEDRTLQDVCPEFPLLVKKIRADGWLSVQVHPNEVTARIVGGEPKMEIWCVLRAGPIFAGFRSGVTKADVERAVADGSFEDLLVRFDAKVGECYFIPGGLVHTIGGGTTVLEVQQPSDTTFRLYDWGRIGADGRPRQLHVREALAAMDLSLPPPVPAKEVRCPCFDFYRAQAGETTPADAARVVFDPATGDVQALLPGEAYAPVVDVCIAVAKGVKAALKATHSAVINH